MKYSVSKIIDSECGIETLRNNVPFFDHWLGLAKSRLIDCGKLDFINEIRIHRLAHNSNLKEAKDYVEHTIPARYLLAFADERDGYSENNGDDFIRLITNWEVAQKQAQMAQSKPKWPDGETSW
jgi:hypothetical protein